MACAICQTRRPRRFCPGVAGDICSICCGQEREVSVSCPLDCPYLQDARRHDKPVPIETVNVPNRDIPVSEKFLEANHTLLLAIGDALVDAAFETPGVVDFDIRDALDALIRTYRTLQSGVYYETVPVNAMAVPVYSRVQEGVAGFRREEQQNLGMARTRDADVLGALVFFQRLELDRNNGRRRGRAFLDVIRNIHPDRVSAPEPGSSLLIP